MLTSDKLTEICCIADDFCKELDLRAQKYQIQTPDKKNYHRPSRMSDSEIIAPKHPVKSSGRRRCGIFA
ncbi:hypothetical protein EZS27_003987 [termite gut metagenome]|uniref:Transposase n=1 Tax=termite gut metagenome TaxID=433724 RepID=A0A5J4SRC8_9ZZZZ